MKRINEYDHLRVWAVIMVIITHAVQLDLTAERFAGDGLIRVMRMVYVFCLCCNMIYVMLSGALLLPWKEEKPGRFYVRHVVRVAVPMVLYYLFYVWQNKELFPFSLDTLKMIAMNLYEGKTPEAPHFWLLYVILAFYILVPFLRYLLKELPYKMLTTLVVFGLIAMFGSRYLEFQPPFEIGLSNWIMVAVMGYWVTRPESRKLDPLIWAGGAGSFFYMVRKILTKKKYLKFFSNVSPVMVLMTLAIFALVMHFPKIFSSSNRICKILSKYSYSILLMHWWTLNWITIGKLHIYTSWKNGWGILPGTIVTLVISLAAVMIIDNLIVNPIIRLLLHPVSNEKKKNTEDK